MMSVNSTEKKLIRIIADHYLYSADRKLTINEVSKLAGISRQAFNQYYKHLKPYVKGIRPIAEKYNSFEGKTNDLISKYQRRVTELQTKLSDNEKRHKKELEEEISKYISTLMTNDIALNGSDEVRKTLEKQALHNEYLVIKNKSLEAEISMLKAKNISLKEKSRCSELINYNITVVDMNLKYAFQKYKETENIDTYEDEKEREVELCLKRVNKLCNTVNTVLVIFIERYLSSFEKFHKNFIACNQEPHILVKLPLFNRQELLLFTKNILVKPTIEIHIPHCENKSVKKAQRSFLFRDVPDIEIEAADNNFQFPSIRDIYDKVTMFKIKQGD